MIRRLLVAALLGLVACGDDTGTVPVDVTIHVDPAAVDLAPGESVRFTAEVLVIPDNGTLAKDVTWEVAEGAAYGTITADGLYTAPLEDPPSLGLTVRARSVARPQDFGSASVSLIGQGSLVDAGWLAFEAGDFVLARTRFETALQDAAEDSVQARLGLGWVDLREGAYPGARTRFEAVLAVTPEDAEALAGSVLAAAALDDPGDVRTTGLTLLALEPGFVFAHDPGVAAADIRWFVARAALDLGDYALAADQLDVLAPDHGLDPAAANFAEAALALLESLQGTV